MQSTKYSCGSHYMKIATIYGEDLGLEGGVVLYVLVF